MHRRGTASSRDRAGRARAERHVGAAREAVGSGGSSRAARRRPRSPRAGRRVDVLRRRRAHVARSGSSSASATLPAVRHGRERAADARPYQRQRAPGRRRNASSEAASDGVDLLPDARRGDRKSGIPLSVLIPAPVRTTAGPSSGEGGELARRSHARIVRREIIAARGRLDLQPRRRVRFAETDATGHRPPRLVLVWFEEARVAYLAAFARAVLRRPRTGHRGADDRAFISYERAAVFDDVLTVRVRCAEIARRAFRYEYVVERDRRADRGRATTHATVDAATHRPARVPDWLVEDVLRQGRASPA